MSILNRLKKLEEKFAAKAKSCLHRMRFRIVVSDRSGEKVWEEQNPDAPCKRCGGPEVHTIRVVTDYVPPVGLN